MKKLNQTCSFTTSSTYEDIIKGTAINFNLLNRDDFERI